MSDTDKPLVWLRGSVSSPPFSAEARKEAGFLLRRCHELRIPDRDRTWRIVYRVDDDAVLILHVFSKKTQRMPKSVVEACMALLSRYDAL